jgi:hypothetical protein
MIYLLLPVLLNVLEEQCRVFGSYSSMEQVAKRLPVHSHYVLAYHGEDEMQLAFVYLLEEGGIARYTILNGSLSKS